MLLPEYCLRLVHLLEQSEHQDVGDRPDAVQRVPRLGHPAGADRRRDHRPAAHRPPGHDLLRRHVLGRRQRGDPQAGAGRHRRDRPTSATGRSGATSRTARSSRTPSPPSTWASTAGGCSTTPSGSATAPPRRTSARCASSGSRWANGGLLILPKLRRQSRAPAARGERTRFGELFLRWNYMASICWSSVSLLVLLAFPFNATLISPLLGLIALPYFLAMASDLRYCGYKRLDVLRIYGFNLILLPVNLAGTLSSHGAGHHRVQGRRSPGRRRSRDRTVAPPFFVIAPYLLIGAGRRSRCYSAYRHHLIGEHGLRRAQRHPGLLRRRGVHRPAQLVRRRCGSTSPRCCSSPPSGAAASARPRVAAAGGREQPAADRLAHACCRRAIAEPPVPARPGSRAAGRPARAGARRPPAPRPRPPPERPRSRGAGCPSLRVAGRPASCWPAPGYGGYLALKTRLLTAPAATAPDLVRALRRRHADPDLPVPEHVGRPGPAERPRLRGRRAKPAVHAELGRRLHAGPGRPALALGSPDRAAAAGRGAGHRVVRRPGAHQPGRGLHERGQRSPGLPVGDQPRTT